ncbi:MAG: B12-binding domain-containing radical SAM protein [Clostridia bacterium]|nr:B12-binding domain-containing radical SAM protein [Clostridia bacterium]
MKKGKALIIIHDLYQEDNVFQLGPAYIAACLEKAGHEVETYCMDIFHYTNDQLAAYLDEKEFDLIGLNFLAARFKETVIDLCKTINLHKKSAWLQLGGHGPSPIPEYVLKTTGADIVGMGECEETIIELMECKLNNGDLSRVKGIAFREGDSVTINPRRNPVTDLDSIPFPAWHLFPMDRYTTSVKNAAMKDDERAITIISSRGCTNRCNFCYRMEKGIRVRSVENLIEEMKLLNTRYGVTYFNTQDELFILSRKRMMEFKRLLDENGLKIKFDVNCRVDIFNEEMAALLKECGCVFVNIGFESTSQKVLDIMNKNTTVEENMKAAEIANKVGLGIGLNCIWGEPGDNEQTLRDNAAFITKYNTYDQIRTIRPVTAYPGCDLYYYAIEKGLLRGPEDFFNKFKNSDLVTVNFTDLPIDRVYELLLEVNRGLILDHFRNTSGDMDAAEHLIRNFSDLYTGKIDKFRGARIYTREEAKHIAHIDRDRK